MPIPVNIEGVGVVNFPDGYTPDRIKFSIENDIMPRLKAPAEKPSALVRLGRGFADVTEGIGQAARFVGEKAGLVPEGTTAAYTKEKSDDIEAYERGRGPDAGVDWMRIGGNVGGTLPALLIPGGGAASLGGRAAAGAAQGAAASGVMFTPEGQSKASQIATGAVLGAAVPVAAQGVRKVGSAIFDRLQPNVTVNVNPQQQQALTGQIQLTLQQHGIDFQKLTSDVQKSLVADAQRALDAGGSVDSATLANKALIESIGAQPTRASITRAPKDWQVEKNLRGITGVGEPIIQREQGNAAAMVDYLSRLRAQSGGKAVTPIEAGESAIGAIQAQDAAKKSVVDNLYNAFRETGAQNAHVPDTKIADTLGRVADEIGTENIPSAVLNRLKEFGFVGGTRTKLLTVNEADKLNRLINNNNPGPRTPASLALGKIQQALNESLLDVPGGGSEALMTARAAAAQRFAEQRAGKGIAAAVDDVSPDRFVKKFVMDADVRDVRAMWGELGKSPQGTQARADVKGHLLDNLLMKATRATNPEDVAGRPFSGVMFSKALDSIPPEKLHVIFTPSELESLRTLQRASKLLTEEVPFSDVNHSKTAAALSNLLLKIGNTPLVGKMVSPLIGTGKIGMDWVKNAGERKQVAEILLGSAANPAQRAAVLPPPNSLDRMLPGALAGAGAGTND